MNKMWEHYDDLPFEVFCTDNKGQRHLISRHSLESEAIHSMNTQNRSGGYAADYWDWQKRELERGSANMATHVDVVSHHPVTQSGERVLTVMKPREIRKR